MTGSQFATLRRELLALRGDIAQRFDGMDTRLTKLEIHLDTKPDKAFVFQTMFTINASFIVVIGLAFPIFRSFLVPA